MARKLRGDYLDDRSQSGPEAGATIEGTDGAGEVLLFISRVIGGASDCTHDDALASQPIPPVTDIRFA